MAEKIVAEALALRRAFDKAGNVSDKQIFLVDGCDAKVWGQGRKWIVGYFGASARDDREKGGLAGVRKADQTNVSKEF